MECIVPQEWKHADLKLLKRDVNTNTKAGGEGFKANRLIACDKM